MHSPTPALEAYFFLAKDFATSRMQSITSFAIGLRVRLLRVTIETALGGIGSATGSAQVFGIQSHHRFGKNGKKAAGSQK